MSRAAGIGAACCRCGGPHTFPTWQQQRQRHRPDFRVQAAARRSAADGSPQAVDGGSTSHAHAELHPTRRAMLAAAAAATAAAAGSAAPLPAGASKLPDAVDRAWEGLGGGPADLIFPGAQHPLGFSAACSPLDACSCFCPYAAEGVRAPPRCAFAAPQRAPPLVTSLQTASWACGTWRAC